MLRFLIKRRSHYVDDGLTVNKLDHVQTEKYLQENFKEFVSQNVD